MKFVEKRMEMLGYASGSPEPGVVECGDIPFLIKRDGSWLYKGSPIARKSMVCLLASMLTRDEAGRYLLESPAERGRIDVEDAPLVVVAMKWQGAGRKQELSFLTNTDECIAAGPAHELRVAYNLTRPDPVPYLHIRDGKGKFPVEARVNRSTYYELVALAEPGITNGQDALGVWSGGMFFPIGDMPGKGKTLS